MIRRRKLLARSGRQTPLLRVLKVLGVYVVQDSLPDKKILLLTCRNFWKAIFLAKSNFFPGLRLCYRLNPFLGGFHVGEPVIHYNLINYCLKVRRVQVHEIFYFPIAMTK
jgi:hypothetical protein